MQGDLVDQRAEEVLDHCREGSRVAQPRVAAGARLDGELQPEEE